MFTGPCIIVIVEESSWSFILQLLELTLTVMSSVVASIECFMLCSGYSPWEFSLVVYFCSRDFITRTQLHLLYNGFFVVNNVYFLRPCF